MEEFLSPVELRVLGCLIEKEMTTPDYYPMTLNALTNAANQKSNRDPVMDLTEEEVMAALDRLRRRQFALLATSEGSRAAKYRHFIREKFRLEPAQVALLGELFLRGAQTLGELRTRAGRMHPFSDLEQVREHLEHLSTGEAPLVEQMERIPGQKERRYRHTFAAPEASPDVSTAGAEAEDAGRIDRLESEVAALKEEMAQMRAVVDRFSELLD